MTIKGDLITTFQTDRTGIAYLLGVSANHVNKLVSRGLPRAKRGKYDLAGCVQWALADATKRSGLDPDEMDAVVEARVNYMNAQERYRTLQTDLLQREVIAVDEVRDAMLKLEQIAVLAFEGLPMRAAPELAAITSAAGVVAKLTELCNEYRRELADQLATLAGAVEPAQPGDRAAAAANGSGLGGRGADPTAGEPATREMAI